MEENDECVQNTSKKSRPRKKHLYKQILQQMEFYFSDANLRKDRYIAQLMQTDPCIPLDIFLSFNKIRALTHEAKDIATALGNSQLLTVTEDGKRVYRNTEVKAKDNEEECTIYVEQLPSHADHDWIRNIFSVYGEVEYVSVPRHKKSQAFKGFAFVEFSSPESANRALEAFGSAGCRLQAQMPPEELCSIGSFGEEEEDNDNKQKVQQMTVEQEEEQNDSCKEIKKRKRKDNEEENEDSDAENVTNTSSNDIKNEAEENRKEDKKKKKKVKIEASSECEDDNDRKCKDNQEENEDSDSENITNTSSNDVKNEAEESRKEDKKEKKKKKVKLEASTEYEDDTDRKCMEESKDVKKNKNKDKKSKRSDHPGEEIEDKTEVGGDVDEDNTEISRKKMKRKRKHEQVDENETQLDTIDIEDKADTEAAENYEKKKKRKKNKHVVEGENEEEEENRQEEERSKIEKKNVCMEEVTKEQKDLKSVDRKDDDNGDDDEALEELKKEEEEMDEEFLESSTKKRKRKRTQKKKKIEKKDENPLALGLRILSKCEWRHLRNKYLNLQRQKMNALKKHLSRTRGTNIYLSPYSTIENGNQEPSTDKKKGKSCISFIPNVIVQVQLPEPLTDTQAFKSEVMTKYSDIAYIDVHENTSEIYIRCTSAAGAQQLITESPWDKTSLLEGENEKAYWEKIMQDREAKIKNRVPTKRGRDKLLKRAERELGKHIRFDV